MARDEALLARVGEGLSPPTLRLYEWREPTISLGYFQSADATSALSADLRSLAVVRRLTGGGAILHDLELTYSFALPHGHALLSGGPNALYERAHDAVIACLSALGVQAWRGCANDDSGAARGPFFCFARRHCFDVLVGDDKIAGSAQRRTTRAVLQHGSVIVGSRFAEQPVALLGVSPPEAVRFLREDFPRRLLDAAGAPLDARAGTWATDELTEADALVLKYAGADWTARQ
ncbi:MAG: Octanoyltransferase LipM [Phycisphaerae bacterium]|nr:Octanoyltransferase LipM [Phycisphaerae bacterium]